MAMYYVRRNPELNGQHYLHREDCPNLPDGLEWLGNHNSCPFPLQLAKRRYITATGCPDCCPDCHTP